jgi:hypothetical protein
MLVILATQEAEIRRIAIQSQPGQIVLQDPISKKPFTKKKRAGRVAQGVGLKFKCQFCKNKQKPTCCLKIHLACLDNDDLDS